MSQDKTGKSLEQAVGRIQQMLDPGSQVTYREEIANRLGINREFDVVVRGKFAGHTILAVIECKDWGVKVGTPEMDAFITKTRDINANLRMIVSPKGFTGPALAQAKDAGVGVLSLLPDDPNQAGFSVGVLWYAREYKWGDLTVHLNYTGKEPQSGTYRADEILYKGAPVINVLRKELSTTYLNTISNNPVRLYARFNPYITVKINEETFRLTGMGVDSQRQFGKKKRFMQMTGDAFYDWATSSLTVPETGRVSVHGFNPDLKDWEKYDEEIPDTGPYQFVIDRYWGCIDLDAEQVPDIPRLKIVCT